MKYTNNHYVPRLILRRYGNKINKYNLKTKNFNISSKLEKSFSCNNLYPIELEKKLSTIESKFAQLLDKKILNSNNKIILNREEIILIKKFLLLEMFRVPDVFNEDKNKRNNNKQLKKLFNITEKEIKNETYKEYIYRTMKVIIESNNFQELIKNEDITYEALYWFLVFNNCYIVIWDSKNSKEDFFITDRGMTCEHEKTKFTLEKIGINEEVLKNSYILSKMFDEKMSVEINEFYKNLMSLCWPIQANFYMFSLSETKMIGLVNPWFKLFLDEETIKFVKETPDFFPSKISKYALKNNSNKYVNNKNFSLDKNDSYIYEVINLKFEDVCLINCLMLDRADELIAFVDSKKILRSINVYTKINKNNNYNDLKDKLYKLGYDFPNTKYYFDLADYFIKIQFNENEIKYIRLYNELKTKFNFDS